MDETYKRITVGGSTRNYYTVVCAYCKTEHLKANSEITRGKQRNNRFYCSQICVNKFKITSIQVSCGQCNSVFSKRKSQITKSPNHFCSKSCAGTFNNKNKKTGTRRSKIEALIENAIRLRSPQTGFLCNDKSVIGSELDFYFPKLKLAVQINGIFHYKPIYGVDKLKRIQELDEEKRVECSKIGIRLIEIDCSDDKRLSKSIVNKRCEQVISLL